MRSALFALVLVAGPATAADPPSYSAVKPLLTTYCARCHDGKKQEGGVDLASFADDAAALGRRSLWKRAAARVAAGEMPPEGAKPLAGADKDALARWLTTAGEYLDCDPARRDPGPPPLRRLTHAEYTATVADLLHVHLDPRNDLGFTAEEPGDGHFDNLAAGLRVSPVLMEKYFAAADKITDTVFVNDGARNRLLNPRPDAKLPDREAAKKALETLARRAYRSPPSQADLDRLLGFYDKARARGGSFDDGIRAAVKPVLVSPRFLFRIEEDRPPAGPAPGVPVDDYELASRLSYFLWGTMPDEELFKAAAQKRLSDPTGLAKEVGRMLAHDRARSLTDALANHWLMMRKFPAARPSGEFFPTFDGLRRPMAEEVHLLLNHVRTADCPVLDLLDADYTFVNEPLARHYRISGVSGNQMRKVDLKPEYHRGGILGTGAVLAMTSHTYRTSPTQRGKYVLEVILGTPPPPPPANAGQLKDDDPKKKQPLTFKEKLAQHASQPACAGCHRKIDPIGFALDNFNAVGEWRVSTKDVPLEVSGVLPTGESVDGYDGLKRVVLARKDQFVTTMVEKALEYALGRELDGQDECTVREVHAAMQKSGYKFSTLVTEIVKSVPFRQRRAVRGTP